MEVKTVIVERKDHPNGAVVINESDVTKDDVILDALPNAEEANQPEREADEFDAMDLKALRKLLKENGVEFDQKDSKETLAQMCRAAKAATEPGDTK